MDLCCCSYRKELSYNTSFDDLPDGLVVDILSRLPVKTLVQSTRVCKLWFSIIKTPSFISAHLSRSISYPSTNYIFLSHCHSPSLTVISDNPLFTRHQDFKFPFETQSTYPDLIGACNGLACVIDSYINQRGRDIYLINPFINKYKRLGAESSCYADLIRNIGSGVYGVQINIGFGYCDVDNDYKVLRIIKQCDFNRVYAFIYKAEIYSLKSGKWKPLDVSIATQVAPFISPAFVHGCLYWQAQDHVQTGEYYLLCFDLKDELFSRIALPKTYFGLNWTWHRHVFAKNASLTIVSCTNDLESVLPCTRICVSELEKKSGEQVRWKEFHYECANLNLSHCIGFCAMGLCGGGGGGRMIFVEKLNLPPEYIPGYIDLCDSCENIVTVDHDNSCAIERLALDFGANIINEATNVSESLVLLSD